MNAHRTDPDPRESSAPSTPKTPKGRFRALAFTGGYDAVVQLGLVHALLVSSGRAPDAVVGVSGGAVNAAALAEILQAGDGDPQAQVDQLRKFLDSYLKIPGEILRSILPDAFEINAVQPLKPIELPIHFQEEREDRNGASRSRWGLSYALNELFGLRLTVRHLTRVTNCALEIVAAANLAPVARLWKRVKYLGILWYLSPRFVVLAPLVGQLLFAATAGSTRGQHGVTAGKLLWHPTRRGWMGWRVLPNVWSYLQMLFLSVLWVFSGLAPLLALLSLVAIADFFILFSASRALGFLSHHIVPLPKVWGVFMPDLLRSTTWLWNGIRAVWQLRVVHLYSVFWGLALLLIVLTFVVPPFRRWRRAGFRKVLDRTLEYLDLNHGLGNTYALKQQLINCFDREYYGKIEIEEVLKRASNGTPEALEPNPKRPKKTLGDYCNGTPPIQVGAVAADVKTGDLSVLGGDVPVVDALLAATAYVPVFPAVEIAPTGLLKRFFIDAGNISREAIGPLLDFIRNEEKLDDFAVVDVYPVHRLLPKPEAGAEAAAPNLIKVALRALQLQRLRDAKIEQRLTRLYAKVLPADAGAGRVWVAGRPFVRAEVYPLEVETQASLGGSMLQKSSLELREVVYQEIADGCRAALEGMIPEAIGKAEKSLSDKTQPWTSPLAVPCREAIKSHRADPLPGSAGSPGPGLSEICERCVLRQPSGFDLPQHLKVPTKKRREWPEWPLRKPASAPFVPAVDAHEAKDVADAVAVPSPAGPPLPMEKTAEWPLTRHGLAGPQRPLVNLLFGGGVFRGVFHMGVLNALNELEITPDLVAGSSVGSIVAAMIAQAFTLNDPKLRRAQIARLAATFLAIDQLVLSDRMADFVRGFTVRAGDTHFSPRDLDLSLRRYDFDGSASFSRRMRNVAAGIERLLYLSPADFLQLVEAGRTRRSCDLIRQLEAGVQKFLARSGVGQEILGAEPLALLIRTHVIEQLALPKDQTALFSSFIDKGIYFLATTTNLTQGELEILGDRSAHGEVLLLEGLLASSAFPAIFRPREGWEVFRNSSTQDRYFDGGIMDNLPLDAVAEFLFEKNGDIARRPRIAGRPVPHLLFTASLEVDKQALPDDRVENVSRSFLRLRKRAKTFIYNRKIDAYAKVQRDLRTIYEELDATGKAPAWKPLDLHLVAVKPQWLCDTFGFHPMLGFRRRKQAQSIAHGCASTLAQLYAEQTCNPEWSAGWGIRGLERMDPKAVLLDAGQFTLLPRRKNKAAGECWFRTAVACPFSPASLAELSIEKETAEQLGKIYEYCGQVETHRPSHGRAAV